MNSRDRQAQGDGYGSGDASWVSAGLDDALARLDRTFAANELDDESELGLASAQAPELALMRELSAAQAVSFGVGSDDGNERGARQFVEQLLAQLNTGTRVQTKVGTRVVATTTIGLGGDASSSYARSVTPAQLQQHREAVARTLQQRHVRMRIIVSTFEVAGKIALATGTGAPLLAVPAAFRYLRGVMAEWEKLGEQPQAAG